MNLIKAIKGFISKVTAASSGGATDIGEILIGLFMYNASTTISLFGPDGILSRITTVGMAFLVLYGVIKLIMNIICQLLFAEPFKIKVGIVEVIFRHLRVNKAIDYATDEKDSEAQAEQIVEVIKKSKYEFRQKSGRWTQVKEKIKAFFAGLLRNKATHAATIAVMALGITSAITLIYNKTGLDLKNLSQLENGALYQLLIAVLSPFIAIIGRKVGIETADQAEIRKAVAEGQKKVKIANKGAKAVEARRIKVAINIIKAANKVGANPVAYAAKMDAMPEIQEAVKAEVKKQNDRLLK